MAPAAEPPSTQAPQRLLGSLIRGRLSWRPLSFSRPPRGADLDTRFGMADGFLIFGFRTAVSHFSFQTDQSKRVKQPVRAAHRNLVFLHLFRARLRPKNGFSKKLDHHASAVSLYVAHYNLCRVHEALRTTPAVALGIAERVWTIGDLLDAVLPLEPNRPVRVQRRFTVIEGGKQ